MTDEYGDIEEIVGPYAIVGKRLAMTDDRAFELLRRRETNRLQAVMLQGAYIHTSANFGPPKTIWQMLWS